MYPSGELKRLADRKVLLQARIAVRRWECAAAVAELSRPVASVDRAVAAWHRVSPVLKVMAVPLGLILTRILSRKRRGKPAGKSKFAALIAALPVILRGIGMFKDALAAHAAHRARTRAATDPNLRTRV